MIHDIYLILCNPFDNLYSNLYTSLFPVLYGCSFGNWCCCFYGNPYDDSYSNFIVIRWVKYYDSFDNLYSNSLSSAHINLYL